MVSIKPNNMVLLGITGDTTLVDQAVAHLCQYKNVLPMPFSAFIYERLLLCIERLSKTSDEIFVIVVDNITSEQQAAWMRERNGKLIHLKGSPVHIVSGETLILSQTHHALDDQVSAYINTRKEVCHA